MWYIQVETVAINETVNRFIGRVFFAGQVVYEKQFQSESTGPGSDTVVPDSDEAERQTVAAFGLRIAEMVAAV